MSTHFIGTGNLGTAPEYKEFLNAQNNDIRKLLRLNVRYDNPVPTKDGFTDRGGFWAATEIWHPEAEHWKTLFEKGMRVLVEGKVIFQQWTDEQGQSRSAYKIEARHIAILPHRLVSVLFDAKESPGEPET